MPRNASMIHQVHIADGFADDCDELIHQCLQLEQVNYQAFCSIWKRQNLGCLYKGRILSAEVAELSEEVIYIAKHYMLKNTSNFEESVVGLFIVYALLNLQPYPGFAHLRIVPQDIPAIDRIEFVARREKRHDVLYILGSVLIKGPVQYHVAQREHGMDRATRKYLEGFTSIDHLGFRPKGVIYRQNEELDIIKDLEHITKRYTQAKVAISDADEFDRNLNYIDNNFTTELQSSLKKLISGIHEEQYGYLDGGGDDSIMKKRKQIKDKAMKRGVDPVKFLMTSKDANTSSKKIPSPKKGTPKVSPKSTSKIMLKRGKKRLRKDSESEQDSEDFNTRLKIAKRRLPISPRAVKTIFNCSADDKDSCNESQDSEAAEINDSDSDLDAISETINKVKAASKNAKENASEKGQESQDEDEEQELDIQIDTLPVLIRTEDQGKLFEIEIIDTMEKEKPAVKHDPPKAYTRKPKQPSALTKIKQMPEVSLKKIDDVQVIDDEESPTPSTSAAGSDLAKLIDLKDDKAKPFSLEDKKIPRLRKRDKRCQKRAHIQSKFKRLGMLPVANFEPSEVVDLQEDVEEVVDAPSNFGLDPID